MNDTTNNDIENSINQVQDIIKLLVSKDIEIKNTIQKLESIFNSTAAGIILYDYETLNIIDINLAALRILKIDPEKKEKYINTKFTFIENTEDVGSFTNKLELITDVNNNIIEVVRNKNIVSPESGSKYIVDVFLDVSDIRTKEALLSSILETTTSGIFYAINGKIYWVNTAFADLLGYHTNELMSQKVSKVFYTKEIYETFRNKLYTEHTDNKIEQKISLLTADGEEKKVIISASFLDKNNKSKGIITSVTDLDTIYDIRDKLVLNKSILKALLNSFPFACFVVDKKNNISLSNNEYNHIFGPPDEEQSIHRNIKNNNIYDVFGYINKEEKIENKKIISLANDELYFDILKSPFIYENEYIGTLVILLDSSERRTNELLVDDLIKNINRNRIT